MSPLSFASTPVFLLKQKLCYVVFEFRWRNYFADVEVGSPLALELELEVSRENVSSEDESPQEEVCWDTQKEKECRDTPLAEGCRDMKFHR